MSPYRPPQWFRLLSGHSRRVKYERFLAATNCQPTDRILDIGSGPGTFIEGMHPQGNNIVALDIIEGKVRELRDRYPSVQAVVASATHLPFRDGEFDIAFSNAVLEHVPPDVRVLMAREMERVADRYCVIIPNASFPLEPHSKTLFIHWLGQRPFRAILRMLKKLHMLAMAPDFYYTSVGGRDLRALFPKARLTRMIAGAHIMAVGSRRESTITPG
jgi:ubiquinone/menaquinone biosynthesis C-methylase UbiE